MLEAETLERKRALPGPSAVTGIERLDFAESLYAAATVPLAHSIFADTQSASALYDQAYRDAQALGLAMIEDFSLARQEDGSTRLAHRGEMGCEVAALPPRSVLTVLRGVTAGDFEFGHAALLLDATKALALIPSGFPPPELSFADDEATLEWRDGALGLIASIDGDGLVGYAMRIDETYRPGATEWRLDDQHIPDDFIEYLHRFTLSG